MKNLTAFLVGLALLLPASVPAKDVARGVFAEGKVTVVLEDGPCKIKEIMDEVSPDRKNRVKGGRATVDGERRKLCWVQDGPAVLLLDDKGEGGLATEDMFEPVKPKTPAKPAQRPGVEVRL